MKQEPLLTFVIPVYNVESYVARCLNSILSQEGVDKSLYEVIIINDGSTDGSLAVVNETVAGYSNVSVHSFANGGLGAARNRGTKLAKGEYIWYIDSDDWIELDSIKTLLPYMDGKNDMVQFGMFFAYADGSKKTFPRIPSVDSGRNILINGGWSMGAPFSIYRRDMYSNGGGQLSFVEGIYHEDNEFTPRTLYSAKQVTVIEKPLYYYYQGNSDSITTKPKIKKCYDLLTVSKLHTQYAQKVKDTEAMRFFLTLAGLELNTSLTNLRQYSEQERNKFIQTVEQQKKDYVVHMLHASKFKYRLMAAACLVSVNLYYHLLLLRGVRVDKQKAATLKS